MIKKLKPLPWGAIWGDFNSWFDRQDKPCKTCRHSFNIPEWEDQQTRIQRIVESYRPPASAQTAKVAP